MDLTDLKDGYKINIISKDMDLFNNNVYTDYSIIKYKGDILIKYAGKTFEGERVVICSKVNIINSVFEENGNEAIFPYSVELGSTLRGEYCNGYHFNIPNIINIEGDVISNEDKKNCEEEVGLY